MNIKEKVKVFREGGSESIQVISDFDGTLTKGLDGEGNDASNSMDIFQDACMLKEGYTEENEKLHEKYYKYRVDDSKPFDFRSRMMVEYWLARFKLLCKYGLCEKLIEEAPRKSDKLVMRENVEEFFGILHREKVPVLVFSAGIGNVVKSYLNSVRCLKEHIHIVSNMLKFDSKGNYEGVENDPIIHTLNKKEVCMKNFNYYKESQGRKNIIVLGDSLTDADMSERFDCENIIRIGFYNGKKKDKGKRDLFLEKFDVLVEHDGTMEKVNEILEKILT